MSRAQRLTVSAFALVIAVAMLIAGITHGLYIPGTGLALALGVGALLVGAPARPQHPAP